jgi:hypothetical protein
MRLTLTTLVLVVLTACAGAEGATGPAGPQGPQGQPGAAGPGTRVSFSVTIAANRTATATLPTAIGTDPLKPPVLACYTTQTPADGVWLAVNDGYSGTSPYCAAVLTGGVWTARLVQGTVGWTALFVVVY